MLLLRRIDTGEAVDAALQPAERRRQQRALAAEHAGKIAAQRLGDCDDDHAIERDLNPAIDRHGNILEALGTHERVNEIGENEESHESAEGVVECHLPLLQPVADQRVERADDEKGDSGGNKYSVEHGALPIESDNIAMAA